MVHKISQRQDKNGSKYKQQSFNYLSPFSFSSSVQFDLRYIEETKDLKYDISVM